MFMNIKHTTWLLAVLLIACENKQNVTAPLPAEPAPIVVEDQSELLAEQERLRLEREAHKNQFELDVQQYRLAVQQLDSAIAANTAAVKRALIEKANIIDNWQEQEKNIRSFVTALDSFAVQEPNSEIDAELANELQKLQEHTERYRGLTRELETWIAAKQQSEQKNKAWQTVSNVIALSQEDKERLSQFEQQAEQTFAEQSFVAAAQAHQEISALYQRWIDHAVQITKAKDAAIKAEKQWLEIAKLAGEIDAVKRAQGAFVLAQQAIAASDVENSLAYLQDAEKLWQQAVADCLLVIATPTVIALPEASVRIGDLSGKGQRDEKPVLEVVIKPFSLAVTETTYNQYDAYTRLAGLPQLSDENWGRNQNPVMNIDLPAIEKYAQWLTEKTGAKWRLPTEFEWEYAARAGGDKDFGQWDDLSGKAHCEGCSAWGNKSTRAVASFVANSYGFYDLSGNVWEWTSSCYSKNYDEVINPPCEEKVLRGGSWSDLPSSLRVSNRTSAKVSETNNRIGFRLVRE